MQGGTHAGALSFDSDILHSFTEKWVGGKIKKRELHS